jgi:hypothetical protein
LYAGGVDGVHVDLLEEELPLSTMIVVAIVVDIILVDAVCL